MAPAAPERRGASTAAWDVSALPPRKRLLTLLRSGVLRVTDGCVGSLADATAGLLKREREEGGPGGGREGRRRDREPAGAEQRARKAPRVADGKGGANVSSAPPSAAAAAAAEKAKALAAKREQAAAAATAAKAAAKAALEAAQFAAKAKAQQQQQRSQQQEGAEAGARPEGERASGTCGPRSERRAPPAGDAQGATAAAGEGGGGGGRARPAPEQGAASVGAPPPSVKTERPARRDPRALPARGELPEREPRPRMAREASAAAASASPAASPARPKSSKESDEEIARRLHAEINASPRFGPVGRRRTSRTSTPAADPEPTRRPPANRALLARGGDPARAIGAIATDDDAHAARPEDEAPAEEPPGSPDGAGEAAEDAAEDEAAGTGDAEDRDGLGDAREEQPTPEEEGPAAVEEPAVEHTGEG